ncbi:amyloid-beta A4 precursor protein-binding family A member 3 isoform X2 [Alligator sinensis]|nr:amyloid-beta A4 precursor protein-binding family A member 3 isoform X2 [Alligator sinensis]XP_025062404.1 amyloid-beta A4 precursor protein-binding family A member 3 isoform X2 [Alligator sinensis]
MTDNSMEFQTDTLLVPSFSSLPAELLEPPAMDLEEGALTKSDLPKTTEQSVHSFQQPGSAFSALCSEFHSSDSDIELSLGATTEKVAVSESRENIVLGGLDAAPSSVTLLGLDLQEADAEVCRDLGRAMESSEDATVPGTDADWKPPQRVGGTRGPISSGQSDLVCMDLDEEPEAGSCLGGEEWTDNDEDGQLEIQGLLAQLQSLNTSFRDDSPTSEDGLLPPSEVGDCGMGCSERDAMLPCKGASGAYGICQGWLDECHPCPLHIATGRGLATQPCHAPHSTCSRRSRECHGLLFAEANREDLLSLLRYEGGLPVEADTETPLARSDVLAGTNLEVLQSQENPTALEVDESTVELGASKTEDSCHWYQRQGVSEEDSACLSPCSWDGPPEPAWTVTSPPRTQGPEQAPGGGAATKESLSSYPAFKEVPGPCDPEDLLDGVIFGAKYLGSTQLVSERNPPTSVRMAQAQEAVDRIKAPEGESQPMTEVDLFVSTQRIKVLTADTQEAMMDHPLQTISYIADIGSIIVLMARRKLPRRTEASGEKRLYKMICHVFHSADAQLIAQAIGQAFSVAYQHFLQVNSIDPSQLRLRQQGHSPEDEELYNGDLAHFSKQENCKEVCIQKQKGEILGIAIVESGWGSILPTVVIANLMHGGPAEKSGELSIGDRLMSVNGTSLVGLPLSTCQSIIRDLKHQTEVTLSIVHCPPVTTAIIRRPDSKYQLGFCVENGIICSLMRGGIAEKGGIRVGHRIIEINGQSVVATSHEKIIQILTQAVSEVHIKTMPASTYRLLTGQEQPIFL